MIRRSALLLICTAACFTGSLLGCATGRDRPERPETRAEDLGPDLSPAESAFLLAASNGSVRRMRRALKEGAAIETRSRGQIGRGRSALHYAVLSGDDDAVRFLCAQGLNPNLLAITEGSALMLAVRDDNPELVPVILDCPADIDLRDAQGMTALAHAIATENLAIATQLIERGANPNLKPPAGEPLLVTAVLKGRMDLATMLIQKLVNVNEHGSTGTTALGEALAMGRGDLVEMLSRAGARIEGSDEIVRAAAEAKYPEVRMLTRLLAEPDKPDASGSPSLIRVIEETGDVEAVRAMLGAGANSKVSNSRGESALAVAAAKSSTDVVEALLSAGAPLGGFDVRSALHLAVVNGRFETIKLLLAQPAAATLIKAPGFPLLVVALEEGQVEIAQELIGKGANPNSLRPSEQRDQNRSALMISAERRYHDLMSLLLEKGADPDLRTPESGETALMLAVQAGNEDAVRILLKAGANPDLRNSAGRSARDMAVEIKNAVIDELLKARSL